MASLGKADCRSIPSHSWAKSSSASQLLVSRTLLGVDRCIDIYIYIICINIHRGMFDPFSLGFWRLGALESGLRVRAALQHKSAKIAPTLTMATAVRSCFLYGLAALAVAAAVVAASCAYKSIATVLLLRCFTQTPEAYGLGLKFRSMK